MGPELGIICYERQETHLSMLWDYVQCCGIIYNVVGLSTMFLDYVQSLTLTFTRYYSRYRGTRLVTIWLDQGFKSYVMYCTVLYCTVLYCTVPYCTVLYCTVLYRTVIYCTVLYCNVLCKYSGIHSRNDYSGFITAIFLEFNTTGDRGG